jgi:hypothetical protein
MGVRLPSGKPIARWVTINLGGEQSLELEIVRPTYQQAVEAMLARSDDERFALKAKAVIVNWRDVTDDTGAAVPFSMDNLLRAIATYPQALPHVSIAINDVWFTLPGDLAKNWQTPPANGGTTIIAETTSTTTPSNSALPSSGGSDYEPSSAT